MLAIIDLKNDNLQEITTSVQEKSSGFVEFRDVCFNYPSRPQQTVLDRLSFLDNPGQTVAENPQQSNF